MRERNKAELRKKMRSEIRIKNYYCSTNQMIGLTKVKGRYNSAE